MSNQGLKRPPVSRGAHTGAGLERPRDRAAPEDVGGGAGGGWTRGGARLGEKECQLRPRTSRRDLQHVSRSIWGCIAVLRCVDQLTFVGLAPRPLRQLRLA